MPIISTIGRKSASVRLLLAVIYLLLVAGGLTMLYPFLLMMATSITGETDYKEFRVLPLYLTEHEARYTKFLNEKYQVAGEYAALHAGDYRAFKDVGMPTFRGDDRPPESLKLSSTGAELPRLDPITSIQLPPRTVIDGDWRQIEKRVALWREFKAGLSPADFGVWYVGRRSMPGKLEMLWRARLRELYGGDVDALNSDLHKDLVAFTEAFAPYEKPDGRLWPGVQGKEGRLWAEFKGGTGNPGSGGLDGRYRRPVDGVVLWQTYLKYKYQKIDHLNKKLGTSFAAFKKVPFPTTLTDVEALSRAAAPATASAPAAPVPGTSPASAPAVTLASEWEYAVRGEMPFGSVAVADGDARYRRFLLDRHGALDKINEDLGTQYSSPADIHWPPRSPSKAELDDVSEFLRTAGRAADLSVNTPDKRYISFVSQRFGGDISKVNQALGTSYASFADIRPPYEEEDLWEFRQDEGSWVKWFLTRNYGEVIDYIAIRGRALWNTLILVVAMIICSLTINPLAAYALSRFRLSYTNQVLLFLLATMAFPGEVTMIPNFLMLRRFPLWTCSVGLGAGLLVAWLVSRRLAGRKKLIAIPMGLGAAVVAGFYVTPLIGRAMGVDLGDISLLNTFAALILPRMASGYGIFLLKGFFDSLPDELFEAGTIDGAGELRMLWQIAFPLSTPILAVMALSTFTATYGSYLWALVVCQSDRMWTLMVYIFQLQQFAPGPYLSMAANVLTSIPTLLVFILAQNMIMKGIIVPVEK
ncbi:MAG: carbohydrate ABC transporter permease [Phycisphaerae bacterium]